MEATNDAAVRPRLAHGSNKRAEQTWLPLLGAVATVCRHDCSDPLSSGRPSTQWGTLLASRMVQPRSSDGVPCLGYAKLLRQCFGPRIC